MLRTGVTRELPSIVALVPVCPALGAGSGAAEAGIDIRTAPRIPAHAVTVSLETVMGSVFLTGS
ncbi:hypothetical protein NS228_10495 [Methylobacterium indicum]|uniref:Secreted protein n=1 Tax=Methylobacterium indicum TaxID=1775910 RepID=A0ABR5H9F4_9HYPH|nr:hypothetical protein QR78_14490 [Methylobacterium indicum]KMO21495.1 hypothetical protein QR79_16865 [Methylobacterium indicum]KTS31026.1 hypothetical protein NS229_14310 [Methylobacterium indicum]KTS40536.1 hypothetical protein NS228_10495 [Methylobacterium indicum]KTS54707.1 hypothetical protein NS230_00595 [Methylobacterium indicum]